MMIIYTILALFMVLLWLVSLYLRNASIVDMFWGMLFVGLVWGFLVTSPEISHRGQILTALVTLWGLRLSLHLGIRNGISHEDHRYVAMRLKYGRHWPCLSLFIVFGLQGALAVLIACPLYTGIFRASALNAWDILGICIFALGFITETVADYQLKQFKKIPKNHGKTMQTGLWAYSRHPNYFGDAVLWWGLFMSGGMGTNAWFTVISPIMMTFLLMRVSGVPLTEQRMKSTRSDFTDYAARTPAFFPRFKPKSSW